MTLPTGWGDAPFGDFLAFMAHSGASDWVWHYLEACARVGVVHAEPGSFLLARPVNSRLPIDDLNALMDLSPEHYPDRSLAEDHDAWMILYASGDILRFFRLAPYPLQHLLWQRDGRAPVRIYDFQKMKDRIHGKQTEEA